MGMKNNTAMDYAPAPMKINEVQPADIHTNTFMPYLVCYYSFSIPLRVGG